MKQTEQPLHSAIAVQKSVKSKASAEMTNLHRIPSQSYDGMHKEYQPIDEEGYKHPTQRKTIKAMWKDVVDGVIKSQTQHLDLLASIGKTNTMAKADVVIGSQTILKDVPVTVLLEIEKHLAHYQTFISGMTTLNSDYVWELDPNSGAHRLQDPIVSTRLEKVNEVLTLAPATKEHPAQTKLIVTDKPVGTWTETRSSGAMPIPVKKELLKRIEKLIQAVKAARGRANSHTLEEVQVADALHEYLFGGI